MTDALSLQRGRRLLVVAAAAAAAAAGLLHFYLQALERRTMGGTPSAVLTLTRDVSAGTTLRQDMLGSRLLPERYLESRHVPATAQAQVLGQRVAVDRRGHETILWSDLQGVDASGRRLSDLVRPGMRAVTLPLHTNEQQLHVRPGDHIDLLCASTPGTASATALLERVLVLAVGEDLGDPTRTGARAPGALSVAVTPADALRVVRAQRCPDLRIALRNPDDVVTGREPGMGNGTP